MARLPRICPPGIPVHLIQRGNNKQVCFTATEDFAVYANWLHESSVRFGVAIHAWVFMTNHVHILATPQTPDSISRMMQVVGRHYVRYFNKAHSRTGTLWEGRFKSCVVDSENYVLCCQRYIELNPVRANMVTMPSEYPWSSYHSNGLGKPAKLWTPHETYLSMGNSDQSRILAYQSLFKSNIESSVLKDIRNSVNRGMALGSQRFKDEVEQLTGRRVTPKKPGPRKHVL
ncbi:Transposase and inactivated derivatives [hydrothermal vent metagenome]|uniref:Transposase and inactivated derivatives n=1 Tax=hydrothermal vent metagenome TaxID=652676 RepID=A0A3B0YIS9_9ZZZZ